LGIFLGPSICGYLISRFGGSGVGGTKNVTSVFLVAVCCSFINFLAAVFIFPESLSEERRRKAREEYDAWGKGKIPTGDGVVAEGRQRMGPFRVLFGPTIAGLVRIPSVLAVFKPVKVRSDSQPGSYRRDLSLTVLGVAYFSYMLTIVSVEVFNRTHFDYTTNRDYISSSICTQNMYMDGELNS
jgi:MFS family permease